MTLRRAVHLALAGIVLSGSLGIAQTRCPMDTRADDFATRFVENGGGIKMPVGAFLLVRKDGKVGAIRLTSIDPAATEWFGKSSYESYFQGDGSGSFLIGDVVRQEGNLDKQVSKGISVLTYEPGPVMAHIGKWSFAFDRPGMMRMTDRHFWTGDQNDHGYEFAPTSACNLSEIDIHDKRLRWLRFDRYATNIILPLAELPK